MNIQPAICSTPSGAIFSDDGVYRYVLWRVWGPGVGYLHVTGLNPSTADAEKDDPTIRREIGYAKLWGYDGLIKTNAFAFRATDPKVMKAGANPIGDDNDFWIGQCLQRSAHPYGIAAWGTHGGHLDRQRYLASVTRWRCFGKTKDGFPKHPLYLPKTATLVDFAP